MAKTIIKGTIVSGLGEGRKYVRLYSSQFKRKIGIIPYPGTLNLRIEKPLREVIVKHKCIVVDPPSPEYSPVLVYCAKLEGISVYLVRPLVTRHDERIAEIISDKYLRRELRLKDGDQVVLEISDCCDHDGCSGNL